jgi:predicted permease
MKNTTHDGMRRIIEPLIRQARARAGRSSCRVAADSIHQDVTFALRLMSRSPVIASAIVLSLGLGVGATTAVFTLLDAALVRDLPVERPQDLSVLEWRARTWPKASLVTPGANQPLYREPETGERVGLSFSFAQFTALEDAAAPEAAVAAFQRIPPVTTVVRGASGTAETALVSGRYFEVAGTRAATGRLLEPEDDAAGAAPAAVISHRLWMCSFGGDRGVIGDLIRLNGQPWTVVGVADESFFGLRPGTRVDLYLPIATGLRVDPEIARRKVSPFVNTGLWWMQLVLRRSPGGNAAALEERLNGAFGNTIDAALLGGAIDRPRLRLHDGRSGYGFLGRDVRKPVSILMALASMVLLLAVANAGNLLLAKSSSRRHEWAMRLALGAGRIRLARQQLTEGVVLGAFGGLAGLALAGPFSRGLLLLFSAGRSDRWFDAGVDVRAFAFSAGVAVLGGLLLGSVPAAALLGRAPSPVDRSSRSVKNGWWHEHGFGRMLVASQVALSLAMLVASGLFAGSLRNLYTVPLGFEPDGIVLFEVDPARGGYEGDRRGELLEGIRRTLESLPQVSIATRSSMALIDDQATADIIRVPGRPVRRDTVGYLLEVGPGFHETLQIPLIAGRTIGETDQAGAPRVAVVNESFVKTYFPGETPLGRRVLVDYPMETPPVTIVGVVRDTRYSTVKEESAEPIVYLPDTQRPRATRTVFAARAAGDTDSARAAIVHALGRAYPSLPLVRVRTFGEQLNERLATERLLSILSSAFGSVGLALAMIGLYAVIAFAVARRTGEIGIRAALGATPRALRELILKDSAFVVVPGVAGGVGLALAATRLLRAHLFGLSPTDPATIAGSVVAVATISFLAAYIPARRASRIMPTEALRCE